MDEFIAWLWTASHWHWWAVAVALIALEVVAPTTYFLWPAAAAALTGFVVWALPELDWRLQVLMFALLSLVAVFAWYRWQKNRPANEQANDLNVRTNRYLGRRVTLDDALVDGRGRLRLDDSWWQVASEDNRTIEAGTTVEIVSHDGTTLIIRA